MLRTLRRAALASLAGVTAGAQAPAPTATASATVPPAHAPEPAAANYASQRINAKPPPMTDRVSDDKGVQYLIEFDELILGLRANHEFRAALKYRQTLASKGSKMFPKAAAPC